MKVAGSDDYSDRCRPETPMGCEIGDLAGKLGTINVAAKPAPYNQDAFFFTDSFLNLTGFQAVIGRSIVVHVPDQGALRIACAPLVEAENLTVTALYPIGGSSLATFSQYSHYQDTAISLGTLPCEFGYLCVCVCGQYGCKYVRIMFRLQKTCALFLCPSLCSLFSLTLSLCHTPLYLDCSCNNCPSLSS